MNTSISGRNIRVHGSVLEFSPKTAFLGGLVVALPTQRPGITAQTSGWGMETHDTPWVVRLTPLAGSSVHDLLRLPLSMDVWERSDEGLVVAIGETQLSSPSKRDIR